jgi:hypothetical protein
VHHHVQFNLFFNALVSTLLTVTHPKETGQTQSHRGWQAEDKKTSCEQKHQLCWGSDPANIIIIENVQILAVSVIRS